MLDQSACMRGGVVAAAPGRAAADDVGRALAWGATWATVYVAPLALILIGLYIIFH